MIPFLITFISDEVNTVVRKCLRRTRLNGSEIPKELPPSILKHRLVIKCMHKRSCVTRNCVVCPVRREGDRAASEPVYRITCHRCARIISMKPLAHSMCAPKNTQRASRGCGFPLHWAATRSAPTTERVWGLAREFRTLARKALEAFWVQVTD